MDLNYLYYRQQVSVFMALNAACDRSRDAHRGLADGYALRIAAARGGLPDAGPAFLHAAQAAEAAAAERQRPAATLPAEGLRNDPSY